MSNSIMNLAELASYLSMSQASLYHLVAEGRIPGTKVGKQWRFSLAAIDDWLKRPDKTGLAILVVDDDPLIRNLMVEAIRQVGHNLTGAQSVVEAKKLLNEFEFDLILLDLLLGDGTGFDVVSMAARLPQPPQIIMITAHPEHELIDKVRKIVSDITVLGKPVRLSALVDCVTQVGRKRQN